MYAVDLSTNALRKARAMADGEIGQLGDGSFVVKIDGQLEPLRKALPVRHPDGSLRETPEEKASREHAFANRELIQGGGGRGARGGGASGKRADYWRTSHGQRIPFQGSPGKGTAVGGHPALQAALNRRKADSAGREKEGITDHRKIDPNKMYRVSKRNEAGDWEHHKDVSGVDLHPRGKGHHMLHSSDHKVESKGGREKYARPVTLKQRKSMGDEIDLVKGLDLGARIAEMIGEGLTYREAVAGAIELTKGGQRASHKYVSRKMVGGKYVYDYGEGGAGGGGGAARGARPGITDHRKIDPNKMYRVSKRNAAGDWEHHKDVSGVDLHPRGKGHHLLSSPDHKVESKGGREKYAEAVKLRTRKALSEDADLLSDTDFALELIKAAPPTPSAFRLGSVTYHTAAHRDPEIASRRTGIPLPPPPPAVHMADDGSTAPRATRVGRHGRLVPPDSGLINRG